MDDRYFDNRGSRFNGSGQSWDKKQNDRNKGDGILGAAPFLARPERRYSNSPPNRSDDRRMVRDSSNNFGERQKYAKGYSDLDPLYHEPLQGELEDDYLYSKSKERKMSHGNSDGLSEDVKQLMNSLGLSKDDMEELSRLPDCELSVNNLMRAIGDLRRKKSTPSHDQKPRSSSSFDRGHPSIKKEPQDYYDPEEPTDLNDRYSPKRAKSPHQSRLSDAFSNFQEKWYENDQEEKKRASSWKSDPPREKFVREREVEYRGPPRYKDEEFEHRQRSPEEREGRPVQRKRPTRWEEEFDHPQPKVQHREPEEHVRAPLEMHRMAPKHDDRRLESGLLGDPHQPNARGLERLVARSGQDEYARPPEKSRFQPMIIEQDRFPKQSQPRRSLPERKRDDGLFDGPIPLKRQSLNPSKKFNQSLPMAQRGMIPTPAVVQAALPAALLAPVMDQSRQVLSAQMQALQVLESEAKRKKSNVGNQAHRDDRGGRKSVATEFKFTKEEGAREADEMRRAKGRVLYLRFKSDAIEEQDIVKLAEPFGKVTNILIVKPTGKSVWYQGFLELEQFDCAAAMVEHFMPNPPRIKGVAIQTQRSKYQTLQLREDQMGRNLAEMIHNNKSRRGRNARYSISPIRENSSKKESVGTDQKLNGKKSSKSPKDKDDVKTKDDDKKKEDDKSGKKKNDEKKKDELKKNEKQKSPEKTKSNEKSKEKESVTKPHTKEPERPKETTPEMEVEKALKNAQEMKKLLKEDKSNLSTDVMGYATDIAASLEKVLKQMKK